MNQFRCETCKYKHPHLIGGCKPDCEKSSWLLTNETIEVIEEVGCASHSDFQSGREKLLDEVLQLPQRREQPNGSMYIYVNDVKELRQKVGD